MFITMALEVDISVQGNIDKQASIYLVAGKIARSVRLKGFRKALVAYYVVFHYVRQTADVIIQIIKAA